MHVSLSLIPYVTYVVRDKASARREFNGTVTTLN